MLPFRNRSFTILACLMLGSLAAQAGAPQAYKWSLQYLIDNTQAVFGRSQQVYPRANRGLGISPDGNFLYVAYTQSFNSGATLRSHDSRLTNTGEIRKIDLRVPDFENATVEVLPYHRAKSIAVDDQTRVYLAEGDLVEVYDSDLKNVIVTVPMENCDGVAVTHEQGETVLYATERDKCELHRFLIDTRFGSGGAAATPAGLGGNGILKITGGMSLRGVAVDPKGKIWIADEQASKVFRVDPDGTHQTSVDVSRPLAIAFYDDTALVSRYIDRQIALVSEDMVVTGNLSVPWEELELSPYGNDHDGALAGIAVIPGGKGFYVANEHGQTANQKSTYGRTDQNSEVIGGKLYTDAFQDDNEPILRAVPVEVEDEGGASPSPSPAVSASDPASASPTP